MSQLIDLTGKKFNMLTVVRFIGTRNKNAYWECKCECGNLHSAAAADIKRGQIKSCGCSRSKLQASSKFKDLTGQIFGRLTVLRFIRMTETNRISIYECRCKCG